TQDFNKWTFSDRGIRALGFRAIVDQDYFADPQGLFHYALKAQGKGVPLV
mgnify:CR=1